MKIYKVLGHRGRITIPLEIREDLNIGCNDILSFELQEDDTILIRKEKVCDNCRVENPNAVPKPTNETTLLEFLNGLNPAEQRAALVHLSLQLSNIQPDSKTIIR
jgi:AbrB family looped-hinge helix DNA binding protein